MPETIDIYYVLRSGNNCVTRDKKFYHNVEMNNNKDILFIIYLFKDGPRAGIMMTGS